MTNKTDSESTSVNGHNRGSAPLGAAATVERTRTQVEDQERRVKRWASRLFAVDELPTSQPWARTLAAKVSRMNARRDPAKTSPRLIVKGDEAVTAGATDDQLAELHALTNGEIAELRRRAAAMHRDEQRQIDALARSLAAQREAAVVPPSPVTLADLLAQPDDAATYRIEGLWPTGGRVLLAAQYKSGKSTMVGNVLRTLVDGGRFLDRFDVAPVGKVALIDTELDTRTLRRWLRDQRIENVERVSVLPLRGAVSAFDILDSATRSRWAAQLADAEVVILDCLRPVLDALGLSEDKDAGRVLVAFDALLAEIGAAEGVVVTHMGHQNERARGDSRLLDWPDALWKIVRNGDDTDDDGNRARFFSAVGRDVSVAEGHLSYDADTRHLAYVDGNRRDSTARAAMPELMTLVLSEPGTLSKNAAENRLRDEHGIAQRTAREAIAAAIRDGSLVVTPGPRNAKLLSPGPDPFTVEGVEQ
ncbi:AAA family ATPase [Gordonia rubripertincta]|uniref:AAA family ATPase n=1 Tax=Gordonia rubripertincta TaxID=36822 RepID=UPI00117FC50D|nr:AAA family ATPase [Gordonia rubripertincta]TSD98884.1 AAA family ATPase [Gordonia rubripertincta]